MIPSILRITRIALTLGFFALPLFAQQSIMDEARQMMKQRNFAEAKKLYESVVESDNKNAEAHYQLGIIYLTPSFDDAEEAVDELLAATELDGRNADYYFALGRAYGLKARRASVINQPFLAPKVKSAFEKTVELNPNHLGGHIGLAEFYWQAPGIMGGDIDKAWKEVDVLIRLDNIEGNLMKARLLTREKKMDEAEKVYVELTVAHSTNWRVWKLLGYFQLQRDKNEAAVTSFTKYVEFARDSADSYDSRAEALIKRQEYARAETDLKRALFLDRNFVPSISRLAHVYEAQGRKKEARETYQWYLAVEKNEANRKNAEERLKALE